MSHREQQVAIVGGVDQRIAMGPVGQTVEMAVNVKIIETIPGPNGIPILVQIDQRISLNLDRSRDSPGRLVKLLRQSTRTIK